MNTPTPRQKQELYDRYARQYQQRTQGYEKFLAADYRAFQDALSGPKILDLGCGPGRDALALKERGLDPLCLDLSVEMLRICAEKGLETIRQNIEMLALPEAGFDGVWSYTSLTTIPKDKVWKVLNQDLPQALKADGILFLGLIEGQGENWKPADQKYDLPRYISRWSRKEVLAGLAPTWELLRYSEVSSSVSGRNTYLHFLLRNHR